MYKIAFRLSLFIATLGMGSLLIGNVTLAQKADQQDQIIGTWRINLAKSSFGRNGPGTVTMHPSDTWTWIFAKEKDGLKFSNYPTYPSPKPARSFVLIADGKDYPCVEKMSCFESGTSEGETLSFTRINPYFFIRVGKRNGEVKEFVSYAISSDGKVYTVTAWSPETPEYQNVFVFDRQE
ncbi:MAG: hypothetical protein LAO08_08080 [Acidobacteriia bacterium]|nr:hypothetical protein [Terriglobia bacterium]